MNEKRKRLHEELRVYQGELEHQNLELRKAQEELEASRDAELYDFAPMCYINFDRQGRVRDINLTGTSLLGVERSRLIGMPFLPLVAPGDRRKFLGHIRRCGQESARVTTGLRLAPAGGKPVDVELQSAPFRDDGGNVVYRTAIIDVTERKRAEKQD